MASASLAQADPGPVKGAGEGEALLAPARNRAGVGADRPVPSRPGPGARPVWAGCDLAEGCLWGGGSVRRGRQASGSEFRVRAGRLTLGKVSPKRTESAIIAQDWTEDSVKSVHAGGRRHPAGLRGDGRAPPEMGSVSCSCSEDDLRTGKKFDKLSIMLKVQGHGGARRVLPADAAGARGTSTPRAAPSRG
jgi:hypothetical protein